MYIWSLYATECNKNNVAALSVHLSGNGDISKFYVSINPNIRTACLKDIMAWSIMSVDASYDKSTADSLAAQILDGKTVKTHTYTFFIQSVNFPTGAYPPIWLAAKNEGE